MAEFSSVERYHVVVDPLADDSHGKLARLTGPNKRVLELGCSTGGLSRLLASWGCVVTGVEIDPEAAEQAAPACDRMIVGDIEALDLGQELKGEAFDVIVAGDVLEHMRDPGTVLRSLVDKVAPGGHLVLSVPNVAHGSVRLALLHGSFPRSSTGLLDDTHLQFFTQDQLTDLLTSSGWQVVFEDATTLALGDSEIDFPDDELTASVLATVESDPLAWVYQFVVLAVPAGAAEQTPEVLPGLVRSLQKRLTDTTRGLEEALAVTVGEASRIADLETQVRALHSQLALAQLAKVDADIHRDRQVNRFDKQMVHLDHLRRVALLQVDEALAERDDVQAELDELRDTPPPPLPPTPPPGELAAQAVIGAARKLRRRIATRTENRRAR